MAWTVESTQNEAAWFDDYLVEMLSTEPPELPAHNARVGHVQTHWHQLRSGVIFVTSNPDTGTADDRYLAEAVVEAKLKAHGFKRATVSVDWDHSDMVKYALSGEVDAKARRLIQSGNVTLRRNGYNIILGTVKGDHGTYNTEIHRDDPNSRSVSSSHCDCDWGQFQNLPRTRQWQRFQDQMCSHLKATLWQALATPLDEDRAPGDQGQQGQMSIPGMGDLGPMQAPSTMPTMQQVVSPSAWFTQPDGGLDQPPPGSPQMPGDDASGGAAGLQAPTPAEALPPFPMDPSMQPPQPNPASIPGGNPGPTPTNPIQYPGGTFSHVKASNLWYNDQHEDNGSQEWQIVSQPSLHGLSSDLWVSHAQGWQTSRLHSLQDRPQARLSNAETDWVASKRPYWEHTGFTRNGHPQYTWDDHLGNSHIVTGWIGPGTKKAPIERISHKLNAMMNRCEKGGCDHVFSEPEPFTQPDLQGNDQHPIGSLIQFQGAPHFITAAEPIDGQHHYDLAHMTTGAETQMVPHSQIEPAGPDDMLYSKMADTGQLTNGTIVQLLHDDYGTLVGRSAEHGAGQQVPIGPSHKIVQGEVLGTDPVTRMVNVLYMGKPFENNGHMMPYGAQAWHWPSSLKARPDVRPPGPNVPRSRPVA